MAVSQLKVASCASSEANPNGAMYVVIHFEQGIQQTAVMSILMQVWGCD